MKKIFCIGIIVLLIGSIAAIEFAAPITISNQDYGCVNKNRFIVDDVDNDGDDDFIPKFGNNVYWYEDINGNSVYDGCIDMPHSIDRICHSGLYYVDMNNDGVKDIVTTGQSHDSLYIFTNNGTGFFSKEAYCTSMYMAFAINIYDFNIDGVQDLFISSDSKSVYLTRSSVNDTFQVNHLNDHVLYLKNGLYNDNSNIIDVNNDGYMDYIGYDIYTNQVVWYEFDPNVNTFTNSHSICNNPDYGTFIFSDINNDGNSDIIIYDNNAYSLRVVLNNQANGFSSQTPFVYSIDYLSQIESYDFNNDGLLDIAVSYGESSNTKKSIYLNSTSGLQLSSEIQSDFRYFWIEDINEDGELDMLCDIGNDFMIYLNDNGIFSFDNSKIIPLEQVQSITKKNVLGSDRYIIAGYYYIVEAELINGEMIIEDKPVRDIRFFNDFDCEDIDNNGVLDYIFVESYSVQGLTKQKIVLYINGTRMQDLVSSASWNSIKDAEFNDVDNDGNYDITFYGVDDGVSSVKVYENCNCVFFNQYDEVAQSSIRRHDFADVNGDGFCDLLYTDVNSSLNVAYNLGGMSFDAPISLLSTVFSDFEHKDANGDGVKDIVTWNFENYVAPEVYLGTSSSNFSSTPVTIGSECRYRSLDFVDFDNDNDNDVLLTHLHNNSYEYLEMEILENDGTMNLTNSVLLDSCFYMINSQILHCTADVNEDGLQDIMYIDYSTKKIKTYINNTIVTSNSDTDIPEYSTKLYGNYPNPFNPETKINYSLAETGNAELTIYNIKGQRVKTLVNDHVESGEHSIIWNGKDDKDSDVSSGVYFYRLKTAEGVQNRKMLLLK